MTRRTGPAVQPVCSIAAVLHGLSLAVSPDAYPTDPYHHHFDLMPPRVWGFVFLIVGLAALGAVAAPAWQKAKALQQHTAQFCCGAQAAVLALWAGLLFVAAADTQLAVTYSAPIPWAAVAAANFVSLWRFGTGR